jgi:hypothetical protein
MLDMTRGVWLIFFAGIFTANCASVAQDDASKAWRTPGNDGINVLYCYLRTHAMTCDYSDLVRAQHNEEKNPGAHTAAALVRIATQYGLRLEIVSMNMKAFAAGAFPVIAHVDGESPESGAFLLVLNISNNTVTYFNGPSATIHQITTEEFQRIWSGAVLLPVAGQSTNALVGPGGAVAGFMLGLIVPFCRSRFFNQQKEPL